MAAALVPDLQDLISQAEVIGDGCVPDMEADAREAYTRLVATVDG